MVASDLVLTDTKAEDAHDELLASLTDLAYAIPNDPDILNVRDIGSKSKRSRFFFRLSDSIAADVKKRRNRLKPKKRVHVDDEISARLATYTAEAPAALVDNIDKVREFFLKQIGPRTLAGGAGVSQARDIVQRMLGTEIDGTQFVKFERMSHTAVSILMAKFIAKYYGLPVSVIDRLLTSIEPRPLVTPQQAPAAVEPYKSRHGKAKEAIRLAKHAKEDNTN